MSTSTRLVATTALLAALATLGACGSDGADDEAGLDRVSVGVVPIVDVAPLYLGEEQGFFAEVGIDLEPQPAQGGAAIVPPVAAGRVDIGFSNLVSLMTATERGLDLVVVAPASATTGVVGDDYCAVVVPGGSAAEDAGDLSGASVAVNTLGNIGTATIAAAVPASDPPAYVELPFPDMAGALDLGRVDAAWVCEPFLTITQEQGARPVLWNYAELSPRLPVAAYFTSGDTAAADPDLVERFASAVERAHRYAEDNPAEVRRVLQAYTEVDPEVAEALVLPRYPEAFDPAATELLAEAAVADGVLTRVPDLAPFLP